MTAPCALHARQLQLLSLIFPIYNEEAMLPTLRAELDAWLERLHALRPDVDVEVVLVDDGSRDCSLELLTQWAHADPRLEVLSFSRNFGHQAACTAGLHAVRGDAVVVLDADLQDPLDVVFTMMARYEEGYDVVYGQRTHRSGESAFKLGTAWLFYRIMQTCVYRDLPPDAGDFRLISRACVDAVNAMPEAHRFLRGMFAWAGFAQIAVPYERAERLHGETKYPLRKMLALAWSAVTSFSTLPIRVISGCGALVGLSGLLYAVYAMIRHALGDTVTGWTTLVCLIAVIGGAVLIGLGIIGEYVGRIYDEVKGRPIYIIRDRIRMPQTKQDSTPDNHTHTA